MYNIEWWRSSNVFYWGFQEGDNILPWHALQTLYSRQITLIQVFYSANTRLILLMSCSFFFIFRFIAKQMTSVYCWILEDWIEYWQLARQCMLFVTFFYTPVWKTKHMWSPATWGRVVGRRPEMFPLSMSILFLSDLHETWTQCLKVWYFNQDN